MHSPFDHFDPTCNPGQILRQAYAPIDERLSLGDEGEIDELHPRLLFDQAWEKIQTLLVMAADGTTSLPDDRLHSLVCFLRNSPAAVMTEIHRKLNQAKRRHVCLLSF